MRVVAGSRLTWPDAFYVTYEYDALGEVTAIKENGSTSPASFILKRLGGKEGAADRIAIEG